MKSDVPEQLRSARIPRHIAVIMDGNGRWAKDRHLPRVAGHKKGTDTVREVVTACRELGVEVLTLYAFSDENWKRPSLEVKTLMKILKQFLISERRLLKKQDIRLRTIGDISRLPSDVQKTLQETLDLTRDNRSMSLVIALSYGGRGEIVRAVRKIASGVAGGSIAIDEIDQDLISSHLDTAGLVDPDLLIRTSGEMRTSNFLPWQATYTELYVTTALWPDFGREDLYRAILDFSNRERRFGLTSEQLSESEPWVNVR